MTGANDEQIRFVAKQLALNRDKSIAGVGDAATIDHFVLSRWVGGLQAKFEPCRERRLHGVRPALDGRSTETEDAKRVTALLGREGLRPECRQSVPIGLSDVFPLNRGRREVRYWRKRCANQPACRRAPPHTTVTRFRLGPVGPAQLRLVQADRGQSDPCCQS